MTVMALDMRPSLRGYIHLASAIAAPFALWYLLHVADSARAYVGASIFGASLILLFTTSASYHLLPWRPRIRRVVKRIDHSAIFALIAGSYTPFCLQTLDLQQGIPILATVGGLAFVGVVLKLGWPGMPKWIGVAAYLAVGWAGIAALPSLATNLAPAAMALLLISGALYTVGAIAYAARWPNPIPRVFGHHEIFHACVTLGCAGIYSVVVVVVLPS